MDPARRMATLALGKPLPKTAVIHHVNGNRADNRACNLVICQDRAYHHLLHAQLRSKGWHAQGATYILRNLDTELWTKAKARAAAEGHSLRWVIFQLLIGYTQQRFKV